MNAKDRLVEQHCKEWELRMSAEGSKAPTTSSDAIVNEKILDERIERCHRDKDFQDRLRAIVEQDRAILDRLATSSSSKKIRTKNTMDRIKREC